jgi:hypothetical protein
LPHQVIEETETWTIYKDANGATNRSFKDHESTPERIDFTIKDRETWEEYKPRMAWNETRVNWEGGLAANKAAREKGLFVTYDATFGYDKMQGFVGSQRLLEAMILDPAWVKDMFASLTDDFVLRFDTAVDLLITAAEEMMYRGFKFDGAFVFDDMGYRNATPIRISGEMGRWGNGALGHFRTGAPTPQCPSALSPQCPSAPLPSVDASLLFLRRLRIRGQAL